ncbi:hypothetical protein ACOMHN_036391 [Nucella lapillus]
MKCVLLFTVLFGAWIGSSEATKCKDIGNCAMKMAEFASADQSQLQEACAAMRQVLDCFRDGLQDCKDNNPGIESQLGDAETQMTNLQTMVDKNCGASGAGMVKISIGLLLFAILSYFF